MSDLSILLFLAIVIAVIVFVIRAIHRGRRERLREEAASGRSPDAVVTAAGVGPWEPGRARAPAPAPSVPAIQRPAAAANGACVFISHSTKDREAADTICKALENRGLACWLASRDVDPGENYQQSIVRAIRAAKVMVLVFTQNANSSPEINKEIALAGQFQLVVIPVRIEDVVPDDALAYELATRQWIDLFRDWERAIERLTTRVAAIIAAESGAGAPLTPGTAQGQRM